MRGRLNPLFAAIAVSAVFATGLIASPFAAPAAALCIVLTSALSLMLAARALFGEGGGAGGHKAGDLVVASGRLVGFLTVAAAFAAVAMFWQAHDLSAEKLGRGLDETAARLFTLNLS